VIHVIATIRLNPGTREQFLEEFRKLVPLVHAEDGCIEYGPTVDEPTASPLQELAGEDAVVVVEKWASVEALAAHSAAPHMADHRARVKGLVRSVSLRVLRPV
jgi:quinol monooxygenase YgiN